MSPHSDPEPGPRQPEAHLVEARVHGRYLVRVPDVPPPWPLLVGFHGYGQDASDHLADLQAVPGAARWLIVSVQALHPFYTRTSDRIVASWMTRLDREHAIADNVAFVGRVLHDVRRRYSTMAPLVFAGFSQGGAMAYRAAAHYPAEGLLIVAADVPPDVAAGPRAPLPPLLIGRGTRDLWYTEQQQESDRQALAALGVTAEFCVFDAGHEWAEPLRVAAGAFLARAGASTSG
jgi:predicted esterase